MLTFLLRQPLGLVLQVACFPFLGPLVLLLVHQLRKKKERRRRRRRRTHTMG